MTLLAERDDSNSAEPPSKDHGNPCAAGVSLPAHAATRRAQGFQSVMVPPARALEVWLRSRQAPGRSDDGGLESEAGRATTCALD